MTNAIIHGFEVDKLTDNVKSVTFLRDDGTLQTLNDDNVTISASFTENGTYLPPSGAIGFDSIEINVPPSGKLETIEVELNDEAQTIRPSVGFDGIGEVRVPKSNLRSLSAQLSPNLKTYTAADDGYFGYSSVSVPGYSSLLVDIDLDDLEDAGIELGYSRTVTPTDIFGSGTTYKGFSSFILPPAILQSRTVKPGTSEQTISPTNGAYGLSSVTVESVLSVLEDKTITENGTYTPSEGNIGFSEVTVDVNLNLQPSVTVTYNGPVTPSAGYNGLSEVVVNVQDRDVKWYKDTCCYTTDQGTVMFLKENGNVIDGTTKAMVGNAKVAIIFTGTSATPVYYVAAGFESQFYDWTGIDVSQDSTKIMNEISVSPVGSTLTVYDGNWLDHSYTHFDYANPIYKSGLTMLLDP